MVHVQPFAQSILVAPALIGVVAGLIAAVALYQVSLLRAAVLTIAAVGIFFVYLHGGVPELLLWAQNIMSHLDRERNFWIGVLAGKLVAGLIIWPLTRRRA